VKVTPEDLERARWDIPHFAHLLGLRPHPGQERIWDAMLQRDESLFHPRWLTVTVSAGNRAGKTLLVAVGVLHHAFYKIGLAPPDDLTDMMRFTRLPYDWYHFGIQQEVGELVFFAIVQLVEGQHEAQRRRGCPLSDTLGHFLKHDSKERGEYRWIRIDPVLGGAQIHFRTTAERAVGSLGKEMHGISFDECGFEMNLEFVVNEVLHFRRLSTGGPLWLISTPSEGFNQFADVWKEGDPENPLRKPDNISFRMSTRDNIGFGLEQSVFDRLVDGYPEHLRPQNVDGYFIQGRKAFFDSRAVDAMFLDSLPEQQPCLPGRRYVQGVDPAAVYDATWSFVIDAHEKGRFTGVLAQRRKGKQKVTDVAEMVRQTHFAYSRKGAWCETALDTTGMGGKVFRQMLEGVHPLHSVEFGGTRKVKMRLITDLKGLIEQGRLRFPRHGPWLELRRQLLAYVIDDRKIEQDAVMALAVAVKQLMRQMSDAKDSAPFSFWQPAPAAPVLPPAVEATEETDEERRDRHISHRLRRVGLNL
jgi:hypothetical protein